MEDKAKTKAQLLAELSRLRQQVAEPEAPANDYEHLQQIQEERRQNQRRMAQLEALRQISLELTAELDLDVLLHSIVLRAIELLEATAGSIYLYRPEDKTLELIIAVGNPVVPQGVILQPGEGLSGKVFETGQPVRVDNYQKWSGRTALFQGYAFTTAMAVPIQLGQEFLGTVNVTNRPTPFSSVDAELLSLFATQAAIAIRNAQLVNSLQESEQSYKKLFAVERRQAQELYLLERVRTALAREMDLQVILRTVVETIADNFGYTQVSIYLLEGEESVLQHQVGYNQVIARIPITKGVSGQVVRTGQPILLTDVRGCSDFLGAIDGLVSEICVPLFDQGQVVGFFNIESSQGIVLDEADLRLMIALSEPINWAITRARLYHEARESAERFRQLAENVQDVFWMTNLDGTETIYVSPVYEDLWGQPLQHIYSQPASWLEAVHPEDRAKVKAQFEQREIRKPAIKEYRLVQPDGAVRWVRERSFPVLNEAGVVYRIAGIVEDITERKQADDAFRLSEQRYRIISDMTSDYTYAFHLLPNQTYTLAWVTDAFTRITGFTAADVQTYDDWLNLVHPADRTAVIERRDTLFLLGQLDVSEFRIITKEGQTRWLRDHIRPIWEEAQNRVISFYGAAQDITERKQTEEALRSSEERFRSLFIESQKRLKEQTALLEATTVISSSLDLPTVLSSLAEQFGSAIDVTSAYICNYNPENMTSEILAEYFSPEASATERISDLGIVYFLPRDLPIAFAFMQSDKLVQYQHVDDSNLPQAEREHLQRFGACTTLLIRLQIGGELLGYAALWESRGRREFTYEEVVLCQGIARQAAVAIQNARLLEQARQDAETKAILLEEVNHRVKNNLTSIIGLLYAVRQHKMSAASQPELDGIIRDLITRVQGLSTAHGLLSAAEWAPLLLSELAQQIVASTLQSVPIDSQVVVQVSPSWVRVTPQQANNLALIINELTTNTIKYGLREQDNLQITIEINCYKNQVLFEFRNSGLGYPPEVLRLERHNMGIYLIQNLVRKGLQGELTLKNENGAVAMIRFPALFTLKG